MSDSSEGGVLATVQLLPNRRRARWSAVLCLCLVGCQHPASPTPAPSLFLRASITPVGANTTSLRQFEGSGAYINMGSAGSPSGGDYLIMYSMGDGASLGNTMIFSWYDAGRLTIGEFPIHEPQDGAFETRKGLEAVLSTHRHGVESYASTTGSLKITGVTDSTVTGRFSFNALRYCFRDPDVPGGDGSCIPAPLDSTAPQVVIAGTFTLGKRTVP